MFASALAATLRLLLLRGGPQDFPYDHGRQLTLACIAFSVATNAALLALMLPPGVALASAAANTAVLALFTRVSLAARKLDNRFQQTLNALLATSGLLSLLMLPFFAQVAPAWMKLAEALQAHPELRSHPEQWPAMPVLAVNALALLGIWQLVLICRIFLLAAGRWIMLLLMTLLLMMALLQIGA